MRLKPSALKYILPLLFLITIAYKPLYILVDELFLNTPACNLSLALQNDHSHSNAGCLIIENNKILLVKNHNNHLYSIPGGTAKSEETSACTAHRETFEETGINVKVIQKLTTTDNHFTIFLCQPTGVINLAYRKKYEIDAIAFFTPQAISSYQYPKQLAFIKDYLW